VTNTSTPRCPHAAPPGGTQARDPQQPVLVSPRLPGPGQLQGAPAGPWPMAPSTLQLGSWGPGGGLPAATVPPGPASPTDSRPHSAASSWHRPGGFSGDSPEAPQGAGAGLGQQGNPRVWQHPQPPSWAGEIHGDGLCAAGMDPVGSPVLVRGQAGQPVRAHAEGWDHGQW